MNGDAVRRIREVLVEPDPVDGDWLAGVAADLDIPLLNLWYAVTFDGDQSGFSDQERQRLFGYGQRWRREDREQKTVTAQSTITTQPDAHAKVRLLARFGRWKFTISKEDK